MMDKRLSTLQIIEINGDRYASLEMAQELALDDVAQAVTNVVHECLAKEMLTVISGQVILAENNKDG